MLPNFFKIWKGEAEPLYNFIDLLIIDEAGQVSPEVAGAAFSLAKKSLVVGDVLQIEPVWSIRDQKIDESNLQKHDIAINSRNIPSIFEKGISASKGNVMTVAHRACKYQKFDDTKGMYLTEHRRSVPEIIGYCNELAYNGRLNAKRESIKEHPLPHIGWAHILGRSEVSGESHINKIEADIIVRWIKDKKNFLEEHYKKELGASLGIVTPFNKQTKLIRNELSKELSKNNFPNL